MEIKVSDYIVDRLVDWGVDTVFMVTGGAAMHLNDSIGRRLRYVCFHHEQAAAMAAECYARVSGKPGVLCVTAGPGGINALNGVFGAYTDSVPMLVLSGQVKLETSRYNGKCKGTLRQLGDQEVAISGMAAWVTKSSVVLRDKKYVRMELEEAWRLAQDGRPGPCWLDIPVDIQGAMVEPDELEEAEEEPDILDPKLLQSVKSVLRRLHRAHSPVILAGNGIWAGGATSHFRAFARLLGIPVLTAWAHDLIASDDPLFCGRPGTIGDRAGNFVLSNADVLLVLGSRLNIRQVGYNWTEFAKKAYVIQVDIDDAELTKPIPGRVGLPVKSDLRRFIGEGITQVVAGRQGLTGTCQFPVERHKEWLTWCKAMQLRYPVVGADKCRPDWLINPYYFFHRLFGMLKSDDVIVCGNASACIIPFQVAHIKEGQRLISNSGCASMGYDIPAAIGAAVANGGKRVICIAGDGSVQFNVQELSTIVGNNLNIKIFVIDNCGYFSISQTQSNFFGHCVGESISTGVYLPDMVRVARAFGIPRTLHVKCTKDLTRVPEFLRLSGAGLCLVSVDPKQEFEPRIKSKALPGGGIVSPALHDMYPFLSEEEMASNVYKPDGWIIPGRENGGRGMNVDLEHLLTPEEVAVRLKVTRQVVYRWINSGQLFAFRVGGLWRIEESAIAEFMKAPEKVQG